MLAFAVPLAALHVLLATRAPWWKIPYQTVQLWTLSVTLIALPIAFWIHQGKRWASALLVIVGTGWAGLGAGGAIQQGSPILAFFSVFLLAYFWGLYAWVRLESERSFFDPGIRWFESRPPVIPGLSCELAMGQDRAKLRVGRIDGDGAFLFADSPNPSRLKARSMADLIFTYRDAQVRCRGRLVRSVPGKKQGEWIGAGLQFSGMSPDSRKELGDFVERLRSEGHV